MPRPGGNPDIKDYGFKQKYEWSEPCSEKMTIRLPPSMKEAIKKGEIEDWQEVARQAIAHALGWNIEVGKGSEGKDSEIG